MDSRQRRRPFISLFLSLLSSLFNSSLLPALPGARARRRALPGAARARRRGPVGSPRGRGRAGRAAASVPVAVVARVGVRITSRRLDEPAAGHAAPVDPLHHRAAPLGPADAIPPAEAISPRQKLASCFFVSPAEVVCPRQRLASYFFFSFVKRTRSRSRFLENLDGHERCCVRRSMGVRNSKSIVSHALTTGPFPINLPSIVDA